MKKRAQYKGFDDFKRQNEDELRCDYNACEDERKELYDHTSFDDYCLAQWQRLS